ncbi:lipocalin family protein [Aquimarina sp. 2201CG14-23]|uniref:lipocalin family protein n=1 Tax=Aquimarina mycalae TaxID=3040073 RepID=UPI002477F6CE|nr:lipocalin family protein [Aquimarina sp. 2201CG14-23]MDH7444693.1 lipocalin family protein [Aquimarina sp. 2201CG14-23]
MKRPRLIFMILSMTLIACSSDDDNNLENNQGVELTGIWIKQSSLLNGNQVTSQDIVEFTSDNKTIFTYKSSGANGADVLETGKWSKNNNDLTVTWDDADPGSEVYELEITELTETTLKWSTVISGEGTLVETFTK